MSLLKSMPEQQEQQELLKLLREITTKKERKALIVRLVETKWPHLAGKSSTAIFQSVKSIGVIT